MTPIWKRPAGEGAEGEAAERSFLDEGGGGFHEDAQVVRDAPQAEIEKRMRGRSQGEAVVGVVVPALGVLVEGS